jgi:catechol 2,3-dioxygenase-like lactoylglutathione lyase family enzyme
MDLVGVYPALLPVLAHQRFDGCGLLCDGEEVADALHDLASGRGRGGDAFGGSRGAQRAEHRFAAEDVSGFGVARDRHVDHPLEQLRLRFEADVDSAGTDVGGFGDVGKGGSGIAVVDEQPACGLEYALLGTSNLRAPSATCSGLGVDLGCHEVLAGVHHVKLPVRDLARSRDWYASRLGLEVAVEFVEKGRLMGYGLRHPNVGPIFGLRLDATRAEASAGFDYFAIGVPDKAVLESLADRLTALGETHAGVQFATIGWNLPLLHDPDGHEVRFYTVLHHTSFDDDVMSMHDPVVTAAARERAHDTMAPS